MPVRDFMPALRITTGAWSRKSLALAVLGCLVSAQPASACCLTDWLYGRQPAYAAVPTAPYAVGYTPLVTAPAYAGGSYAGGSYMAGYTPVVTAAPNSSALPLAGSSIYTPSAPYALQRPAYGAVPLDNPSVYTGRPVMSGYRGAAATGNSFYGTGNIYPNNYASVTPTVTAMRPTTTLPTVGGLTVPVTAAPTYPTPVRSGLARFFNSLLGTGYRSSYYTAPITYYRPATTVDPVTGTTVTVQQPCTSTVQQLQRTPLTTFQPLAGVASASSCGQGGCATALPGGYSYGAAPIASTDYPSLSGTTVNGGIRQTGDLQPLAPPSLPSSQAYSSSGQLAPWTGANQAPLTGAPPSSMTSPASGYSSPQPYDSVPSSSDRTPLEAPQLRSARPATPESDWRYDNEDSSRYQSASPQRTTPSYQPEYRYEITPPSNSRESNSGYGLDEDSVNETDPNSLDSNFERSRYEIQRDQRDLRNLTTQNQEQDGNWHRVRPIPAPEGYRNPFDTSSPNPTQTVSRSRVPADTRVSEPTKGFAAPDLLPALPTPAPRFQRQIDQTSGEMPGRLSVPVREASIQGQRDRVPTRSDANGNATRSRLAPASRIPAALPRTTHQESGWYSLDR